MCENLCPTVRHTSDSTLLEDGLGEVSDISRPLKDSETAEWILLDGVCTLALLVIYDSLSINRHLQHVPMSQ